MCSNCSECKAVSISINCFVLRRAHVGSVVAHLSGFSFIIMGLLLTKPLVEPRGHHKVGSTTHFLKVNQFVQLLIIKLFTFAWLLVHVLTVFLFSNHSKDNTRWLIHTLTQPISFFVIPILIVFIAHNEKSAELSFYVELKVNRARPDQAMSQLRWMTMACQGRISIKQ